MAAATEKRTQIDLTAEQHGAAMSLARSRGTSLAGIVREALDGYLAREADGSGPTWEADPALELIGKLPLPNRRRSGDLVEEIDRVVYERSS